MERNGMKKLDDLIPKENIQAYLKIYQIMRKALGHNKVSRSRHRKSSESSLFNFDLIATAQKTIDTWKEQNLISEKAAGQFKKELYMEAMTLNRKSYIKHCLSSQKGVRGPKRDLPYDFLVYALVYDAKIYNGRGADVVPYWNVIDELANIIRHDAATRLKVEIEENPQPIIPMSSIFEFVSDLLIANKIISVNDPGDTRAEAIKKSYERFKRQFSEDEVKNIFYISMNLKRLNFLKNLKYGFIKEILIDSGLIPYS